MDLISVIIPSFNHQSYIRACIESVFIQDDQNFEILVVDDGSTDQTAKIAESLIAKSPVKMKVVVKKNAGAHDAINFGIRNSSGKILSILNSDDLYSPGRLRKMRAALCEQKTEMAFSKIQVISPDSTYVSASQDAHAHGFYRQQADVCHFPTVGFALVNTNVAISTGNFFFTRALYEKVGSFRALRYCHDWDFILRSLIYTEPAYVSETLYSYRLHSTNSFKKLSDSAGFECPFLMSSYLKSAIKKKPENPLAPSPHNWPFYFDHFIKKRCYDTYFLCSQNQFADLASVLLRSERDQQDVIQLS